MDQPHDKTQTIAEFLRFFLIINSVWKIMFMVTMNQFKLSSATVIYYRHVIEDQMWATMSWFKNLGAGQNTANNAIQIASTEIIPPTRMTSKKNHI